MAFIIIGVILLGAAFPAWYFLSDLGMDVFSVGQWLTLIGEVVARPLYYKDVILPLVAWAVLAPVVGLTLIVTGLRRRRRQVPELRIEKGMAGQGGVSTWNQKLAERRQAELAASMPSESAPEPVREPVRVEEPAHQTPLPEEKGPSMMSRLAGTVRGIAGKATHATTSLGQKAAERVGELRERSAPSDGPSLADRVGGFFSSLKGFARKPKADVGRQAPTFVKAPAEPRANVADEIIAWYGAWGNLGRGPKPEKLLQDAQRLVKQMTNEDRGALISAHGLRGYSALSALEAAASYGGAPAARQDDRSAAPMEQPALEDLVEKPEQIRRPTLTPASASAPETQDDMLQDPPEADDDQSINPFDLMEREAMRQVANPPSSSNMLGDLVDEAAAEVESEEEAPGQGPAEGRMGSFRLLEVEDDTAAPPAEDAESPDRVYLEDQGAQRILRTTYKQYATDRAAEAAPAPAGQDSDFTSAPAAAPPMPAEPIEDVTDEKGDDRSSTSVSNEAMEAKIAEITPKRMMAMLGEAEGSPRWTQRRLEEYGLGAIKDRSAFVPTLWAQLAKLVDYQTKAFAWDNFGAKPPAELATVEQRETFLIKVATSIVTLREQVSEDTIKEIQRLKAGSEEVAWLSGRADLILKTLSSPENRARLRLLVKNEAAPAAAAVPADKAVQGPTQPALEVISRDAAPEAEPLVAEDIAETPAFVSVPQQDLIYLDQPYEENWKIFDPVLDRYKRVATGEGIDVYRTLQVSHRPDGTQTAGEQQFGVVDVCIGNLRQRPKPGNPMRGGVIGIMFVPVPAGDWALAKTEDGEGKDTLVLLGTAENAGRAIRVRDNNLDVLLKWLGTKQMRGHGVIHFILEPGAEIRGLTQGLTGYELRTSIWSEGDWEDRRALHILPKRAA